MIRRMGLLAATLLILGVVPAQAASINIFNTGLNGSGGLLPFNAVDPHYTVGYNPATPFGPFNPIPPLTGTTFVTTFPLVCCWIPNSATSQWLSQTPAGFFAPSGFYAYSTTFNLTGLRPATAVLTGQWMTDNNGVGIVLNGNFFPFTTSFVSFAAGFSPFTINSGFVPGVNTLTFVLFEDGFISGFRAEVSGSAAVIPEPATLLLVSSGLAGVWLKRRSRLFM